MAPWTAEEQSCAKAVQKLSEGKEDGLKTAVKKLDPPAAKPESGGSDDIGDVSWALPTITLRYPSNIPNLPGHNWVNAIAMATPIAHKGNIAGSKVMAMTMVDLLMKPELIQAAKTYFADVELKKQEPQQLLADNDEPQSQIKRETIARCGPEGHER